MLSRRSGIGSEKRIMRGRGVKEGEGEGEGKGREGFKEERASEVRGILVCELRSS